MAAGEGEETTTLTTTTSTPSTSPKSKLKILCSHGGKILPRPIDGHLKYVGGETRVVALPRDISFSGLMEKLTATFEGDMVLKYQMIPEELDALVSVRSDDDLRHMVDEYERQESGGSPKLRAFLFPSTPVVVQNQSTPIDRPLPLEQRYIDAINGIIRKGKLTPISVNSRPFSISSACSSPKPISPEGYPDDHESIFSNAYQNNRLRSMHKVRSSPSLSNLNEQHNNNKYNNHSHHHIHPTSYQHHYHHHTQTHNHHSSSRPPQDPHRSSVNERLVSPMHNSRVDSLRGQMGYIPNSNYYHSHIKNPRAASVYGSTNTFQYVDDGGTYGFRKLDRADTLPRSPRRVLWE